MLTLAELRVIYHALAIIGDHFRNHSSQYSKEYLDERLLAVDSATTKIAREIETYLKGEPLSTSQASRLAL